MVLQLEVWIPHNNVRVQEYSAGPEATPFFQSGFLGCWRIALYWGPPLHPAALRGKSLASALAEEKRSVLERQPWGRRRVPEARAEEKVALTVEMDPGHQVMGTQGPTAQF